MGEFVEAVQARKVEILKVVASLGVLLLTAPVVVQAGSIGWEQGLIHSGADMVASVLPGNIDVPVVILAGIISALLLLFAVDSTKRIQTVLLVPVVIIVALFLGRFEHVVDAITREPAPYTVSLLVTLLGAGILTQEFKMPKTIRSYSLVDLIRIVQFPGAAYSLYLILATIVVIITFQYPFMARSSSDPSMVFVILSGLLSLTSLGVFIQYTDQRHIITVAPNDSTRRETTVYVFGGLYYVAKSIYNGSPLNGQSKDVLEHTIARPEDQMTTGFDGMSIEFRYLPENILKRGVLLKTDNLTTRNIDEEELIRIGEDRKSQAIYHIHSLVSRLLPVSASKVIYSQNTTNRILRTDSVLLMTQFPEDGTVTESLREMIRLMEIISKNTQTEAKLVITHAHYADRNIDTPTNYDSAQYKDQILAKLTANVSDDETAESLEYIRTYLIEHVYPVSGDIGSDDVSGFDSILRNL